MKIMNWIRSKVSIILIGVLIVSVILLKVNLNSVNNALVDSVGYLEDEMTRTYNNYNRLIGNELNLLAQIQTQARLIARLKTNINIKRLLKTDVFVRGLSGEGAGTIIKKTETEMYVLTCNHVIDDITEFYDKTGIKLGASIGYSKNDKTDYIQGFVVYGAEIIKTDKENDLALLKVFMIDDDLEVAKIADEEPQKGDVVYSVGSPLGVLRTVSQGILSNKVEGFYISDNTSTFGNSGGGLYNDNGELIGVPAQVMGYGNGELFAPESSLGMSINLPRIKLFLDGEI